MTDVTPKERNIARINVVFPAPISPLNVKVNGEIKQAAIRAANCSLANCVGKSIT